MIMNEKFLVFFRTSWISGVYFPSVIVGRESLFVPTNKVLVTHVEWNDCTLIL